MSMHWIGLFDIFDHLCLVTFSAWQVDNTDDPHQVKMEADRKGAVCLSALTGEGLEQFCDAVQEKLRVLTQLAVKARRIT